MPRIRTIKPDFFTSETIAKLRRDTRLTFIGLWTHVDDEGRCVDNTKLIHAAIWPLDEDRTPEDVDKELDEMELHGLIERYNVAGRRYLCVLGLGEHQRINRPTPSKLPGRPKGDASRTAHSQLSESSVSNHSRLTHDSPPERKGKEGRGGDQEPTPRRAGARDYVPDSTSTRGRSEKPQRPKTRCNEHGQPDDRSCTGCALEHGDRAFHAKQAAAGAR